MVLTGRRHVHMPTDCNTDTWTWRHSHIGSLLYRVAGDIWKLLRSLLRRAEQERPPSPSRTRRLRWRRAIQSLRRRLQAGATVEQPGRPSDQRTSGTSAGSPEHRRSERGRPPQPRHCPVCRPSGVPNGRAADPVLIRHRLPVFDMELSKQPYCSRTSP
jgi:hypothetical protein